MSSSQYKVFSPEDGPERFREAVEEVHATGSAISVYRDGEFDPDSPDVNEPIAYLVSSSSSLVANNRQAQYQLEALKLQVDQGYMATRVNAMEMALKAMVRESYVPSPFQLTRMGLAIEAFLLDGSVSTFDD